jgi:PglZ domain
VAWAALADRVLELPRERLDALGLLEWTLDGVRVGSLERLPERVRDGLLGWLGERTGEIGQCTIDVIRAGHGVDAVPLALVAGLLADERVDQVVAAESRGRLASRHGGRPPTGAAALDWAEAARALVERPTPGGRVALGLLDRAQSLLAGAGAGDLSARSAVLPAGLDGRLRGFARELHETVQQATDGRSPDPAAVERAYLDVTGHVLAELEPWRVAHAGMAMRLARWLAVPAGEPPATIADAVARQVRDDGWVDRARADVWAGDGQDDPVVADAYRALYQAVTARRARHDRRFGELLAAHTAADARPGSMLHVEAVLDEVILPLARQTPVLLVVVDGMSVAVAAEVADGAAADGWVECLPAGQRVRRGALATLPTVTEVSRVSLLCGALARGGQTEEAAGLNRWAAGKGLRSTLFHKADLERSAAGEALPEHVRAAVQDHSVRLVAVVLNTVDDALDRADPGRTAWNLETISHLRSLLGHARGTGRVVVLASDHGHVIERRDSELRSHRDAGGARWRPAGPGSAPPTDGEIAMAGSRVLLGGGQVVLPWRETVRYLPLRAGYHGGASPAEAVILVSVHVSGAGDVPRGWEAAPPQAPAWWLGSPVVPAEPAVQEPAQARWRPAPPTLFDQQDAVSSQERELARRPAAGTVAGDGAVAALLASPVYQAQRERARRVQLDQQKLAAMLGALLAAHGRLPQAALAAAAGIPEFRLPGVMSALQRLLNVDGYEVVGYDPDGETVVLDRVLLREQFRLDEPG